MPKLLASLKQSPANAVPQQRLGERIADGCVHVIGVAASLVALFGLLIVGVKSQTVLWVVSLTIYGLALVTCFSCSAGYHLIVRPKLKEVFHRLDHAAIFLMIAGTYTPFAVMKLDAPSGLILLSVVWIIAALGIVIRLTAPRYLDGVSVALYLVQGWAVLAVWYPLTEAISARVAVLLMIGGLLYTVGVVFHLSRIPYQRAIWHVFVLTAASFHYAAVVDSVWS
ncbi:hemolysin III family protein [Methyloligella sp. 2.7D]|uniref:PAQR family membrane homeostasis protein TrhA n=1 Tax=unclassified Methyloligella TaxID=2625955 RepID=UPI00157DA245|nr:hemolysin III family protein [Methyloligella sp. GL2]QKP77973.1 hemolysin III family protein [Methyloligella sp. GL2]